jgi:Tol biopolymer transport system component
MPLTPGTRLGPFEVRSAIGAGGMGEVYRALDTRLDREVAVKVLPEAMSRDPERLTRFEREAKALAALNHPNVAQIYGVEAGAIVMELIPGETLCGPLPLATVLDYASQIAAALEAAHEKGIVHRDLKPGNVMVTPDGVVKVLDFSLAGRPASETRGDPDLSPTLTLQATQAGMIVGTAAYMAPEQASARPVDKRADIWAFGVVLWEMLTGRRMFEGETISHVLAAVLTKEPDLTAVPPRVRLLLSRCLEKDPKKRLRDIGDAMSLVAASDAAVGVVESTGPMRRAASIGGWSLAALLLAALVATVWFRSAPAVTPERDPVRFQIERALDVYNRTASAFAVSPDGRLLAYYGAGPDGPQTLLVRALATGESRAVPGSATAIVHANSLFWSFDSRQLVRSTPAGGQVFDIAGATVRALCDCRYVGGSWNRDGTILLGAFSTGVPRGIRRLAPGDRNPTEITVADASRGEVDTWPTFLPDGRRFLFTRSTPGEGVATYLGTLDGREIRRISDGSWRAFVPAAAARGAYLLGIDSTGLVAQRFDLETMSVTGTVSTVIVGATSVSASQTGVLASSGTGSRPLTTPTWFDRRGTQQQRIGEPRLIEAIALSFDGRRLATAESLAGAATAQVWLQDLASGARTRATFGGQSNSTVVWSPTAQVLAFSSRRDGRSLPFQRAADGTGPEVPLFEYDWHAWVNDWSSDGQWLIVSSPPRDREGTNDLWAVAMAASSGRKPAPYLTGPGLQQQAQFSPDGRFVAYGSDQGGTFEIYVQPFPNASEGKWMISNGGGVEPRWSRDGKELFYFAGQTLMRVPVTLQPTFSAGPPTALFEAPIQPGYTADSHRWQLAPDGRRFLLLADAGKGQGTPLDVIVNWTALLPK